MVSRVPLQCAMVQGVHPPPPHVSLWFVELNGDGCAPLTKCLALSEDLFDTEIIFKKLVWGPSPCNTRHNNLVKGNGIRFQEPASSLFLGCYEEMGPLAAACKLTINIPWTATGGGEAEREDQGSYLHEIANSSGLYWFWKTLSYQQELNMGKAI